MNPATKGAQALQSIFAALSYMRPVRRPHFAKLIFSETLRLVKLRFTLEASGLRLDVGVANFPLGTGRDMDRKPPISAGCVSRSGALAPVVYRCARGQVADANRAQAQAEQAATAMPGEVSNRWRLGW